MGDLDISTGIVSTVLNELLKIPQTVKRKTKSFSCQMTSSVFLATVQNISSALQCVSWAGATYFADDLAVWALIQPWARLGCTVCQVLIYGTWKHRDCCSLHPYSQRMGFSLKYIWWKFLPKKFWYFDEIPGSKY